jgi:hypothetical protein
MNSKVSTTETQTLRRRGQEMRSEKTRPEDLVTCWSLDFTWDTGTEAKDMLIWKEAFLPGFLRRLEGDFSSLILSLRF